MIRRFFGLFCVILGVAVAFVGGYYKDRNPCEQSTEAAVCFSIALALLVVGQGLIPWSSDKKKESV